MKQLSSSTDSTVRRAHRADCCGCTERLPASWHASRGTSDYYCIDGGNGTLTSVSLFENRSDGESFNTMATNWVQEHLGTLLPTSPKVMGGEVHTHATGKVLAS